MNNTRNSEALASFVAYCQANPEQRFWQALRNWSRFDYILGFNGHIWELAEGLAQDVSVTDTFNIEGLRGTRHE